MKPPDNAPGTRYKVTVLKEAPQRIEVLCPVCLRDFKTEYGVVKCPFCGSKLKFEERK